MHGYAGLISLVIAVFMLWGALSSPYEGYATFNPLGNFLGAIIMFGVLGFLPGWIAAKILHACGLLRIPREIGLLGLDFNSTSEAEAARTEVREVINKANT